MNITNHADNWLSRILIIIKLMKKYQLVILFLVVSSALFSQNDIRLYTDEADCIRDIALSDTNDYIANIDVRNVNTFLIDSSVVEKIGKNGEVIKTLNMSSHFPNARVAVYGKLLKLMPDEYIALCNIYSDQEQLRRTALLYFDDDLEITSVKMIGDTLQSQSSWTIMINSKNKLMVGGFIYHGSTGSNVIDSVFIREYTLQGEKIKEGYFVDTNATYVINNIVELPYYGLYVLDYYGSVMNLYVDTNLTSARIAFNGCSGCIPNHLSYQISDRKFIKGVTINWIEQNLETHTDVGFMVKDTTPSIAHSYDSITVVYKFGELNHYDFFCGLDFVAPDTVFLLYKFIDTTISNRDVYTLQKLTTTGTVIWSKNYTCNVNRWLQVKATASGLLMYGRFWNGDDHLDDIYTWNPIIIRLNKEGVIQSTTDINFQQAEILVYPNPTNSTLNLNIANGESGFRQVKVLNMMGQCVYESQMPQSRQDVNLSIDVSGFAKGAYFIRLLGDKDQVTKRFVVN